MEPTDSVAIVSGGLDSTTLVYDMLDRGLRPHMLSFNYGQRHKKELYYAKATAEELELPHDILDLSSLTHLISNSALTSGNLCTCGTNPMTYDGPQRDCPQHGEFSVPEGHYAEENMAQTVVPNRNMIMISIAAGIAVNEKAQTIGIGVHSGDHFVYPDCRPNFVNLIEQAILVGNDGFHELNPMTMRTTPGYHIAADRQDEYNAAAQRLGIDTEDNSIGAVYAPFMNKSKADIAYRALELRVPFHTTWSCYKGEDVHCGKCGTCVERLEAIDEAAERFGTEALLVDATEYADSEFWKQAIASRNNS